MRLAGLYAQGDAGAFELGFDLAGGIKDVTRRVPRAGVDQGARLRVEAGQQEGHIPIRADVLRQDAVGAGEDIAQVFAVAGEDAEIGAGFRHEQRRPGSDRSVAGVIEIGADALVREERIGGAAQIVSWQVGGGFGEQALLDLAGNPELFLVVAEFLFGALAFADVADKGDEPVFVVQFHLGEDDFHGNLRSVLAQADGFARGFGGG